MCYTIEQNSYNVQFEIASRLNRVSGTDRRSARVNLTPQEASELCPAAKLRCART